MPNTNLGDFAASRMSVMYTSFGNIWTKILRALINHHKNNGVCNWY